eukprot:COSAG02_NODE_25245_length_664_cov_1.610619_1_plen_76_part_00
MRPFLKTLGFSVINLDLETKIYHTLDYFQCPRVFVPPNDKWLGSDKMYMPADDTIKDFCCNPRTRVALIHMLLES